MTTDYRPTLFMIASTFTLSLNGVLAKWLSHTFTAEWLSFLRFAIPAIILFIFLAFQHWQLPPRNMWKGLLVRALCISASQWCFLYAIDHLTLVETVVLFSTGPLFIPLLEKLFFGASIKSATFLNLILMFIGVMLQAGNSQGFELKPELLLGLAAGIFNAGSQLSLYRASKGSLSPSALNAWTFSLAALILLPVVATSAVSGQAVLAHMMPWQQTLEPESVINGLTVFAVPVMLLLLSLCIINTQVMRAKAYRLAESGSQLAPLIFTNLLFTVVWQVTLFDQAMPWNKVAGVSIIVFASLLHTFLPIMKKRVTLDPAR
ncbi:DMT family transporter [Photobacterium sanguinicancri]|uniref:DMT family transporter n=1 Tax=Photobacterium sanguinicancri TaxID=875932 RepID=UPI00247FC2D4|nr:DMT family transporter [Photobacterium sanguinicancri]